MTRRPDARARTMDALNRLDVWARDDFPDPYYANVALSIRHLVEALDRVLRNSPGSGEYLESHVADACAAVGVEGP